MVWVNFRIAPTAMLPTLSQLNFFLSSPFSGGRLLVEGELILGVALALSGAALFALARKHSLLERPARSILVCLATFIFLFGLNEIAIASLILSHWGNHPLVEHSAVLISLITIFVFVPWLVVVTVRARRVQQSAIDARATQRVLTERYAASSTALARTTDEAHRLAALVQTSRDAVIGINQNGIIWHFNEAAEKLFRRNGSEMVGASAEQVRIAQNGNLWREIKRMEAPPYRGEFGEVPIVCGDGSVVPVWMTVSPIPAQSGGGTGYSVIARDMTEKRAIEERISKSLREKDALLKEVHHRVKNNLQLICSLLRLQAKEAQDDSATKLFRKSEERIRSLALVHDKVYRSESLSTLNFGSYVTDLVGQLVRAVPEEREKIHVEHDCDDLIFPVDTAITCGLVLNELVNNSLKHAAGSVSNLKLRVALKKVGEVVSLSVWDNGTGPVEPDVVERATTLGLSLVRALVRQLGGGVRIRQVDGVTFEVTLPASILVVKEPVAHQVAA